ncbi:MAG: RNA polymerase-binding protein DksA [Deltaproteobacteria bacterium]|nr:RNA polymerase-binding protein DksA [Deltaproteobacteria bacterium]
MKKKIKKAVKKATPKKPKKKVVAKKAASKSVRTAKTAKKPKVSKVKRTSQNTKQTPAPVVSIPVKKAPEIRFTTRVFSLGKIELEKFKRVLENQLLELQSDFGKKYQSISSTALPDINDQASAESERNFEIRIKDRERKLIGKVQEALKKVAEGTYGICESCGEAIGSKRLMARPVTNLCINCKAEMEADEKREESLMVSLQQGKSSPL